MKLNQIQQQIFQSMIERILDGNLRPGERLPTEIELAGKFSTCRMNAHKAVKKLEQHRFVTREKRRGTFLNDDICHEKLRKLGNQQARIVYVIGGTSREKNGVYWSSSSLQRMEEILCERSFRVVYGEMPDTRIELSALIEQIQQSKARNLFLIIDTPVLADFLKDNFDVFNAYHGSICVLASAGQWPWNQIRVDFIDQGAKAVEHMLKKSFDDIFFMVDGDLFRGRTEADNLIEWCRQRYCGADEYCRKNGSGELELAVFRNNDFSVLLERVKHRRCAVIACSDRIAVDFINAAKSCNLRAPEDFMIIGFDNQSILRCYNLTTLALPMGKIGRLAASLVCNEIGGGDDNVMMKLIIKSQLVERSTT